jgi:hypothetical protein
LTANGLPEVLQLGGLKVSTATSEPPRAQTLPPLDPLEAALERLGPWLVLKRDPTGKRAVAQCSHCQTIKEIGVADGCIASCGCSGSWPGAGRLTASTFADGIAGAERFGARGRHRGRT